MLYIGDEEDINPRIQANPRLVFSETLVLGQLFLGHGRSWEKNSWIRLTPRFPYSRSTESRIYTLLGQADPR